MSRFQEARKALERLARSDAGKHWAHAIDRELLLITQKNQAHPEETEPDLAEASHLGANHQKAA